MNPLAIASQIDGLIATLSRIGTPLQIVLVVAAVGLLLLTTIPSARDWRGVGLVAMTVLLLVGELVLAWFHWRLYQSMPVVNPTTSVVTGHVAAPLWIESEKLYLWALVVAVMGVVMRRDRRELLGGVNVIVALFTIGGVMFGKPFTEPLPGLLSQYGAYLQAMLGGAISTAQPAFEGMEGSRQFFYNSWYMWVHPPLLFFSYGAFTISFVATLRMIRERRSRFETTAYRWARLGYLALTTGMLLGFPWAIIAWQGESWWWSGKVNMSLMMWLFYTAYLHARLYLRRRGMWRWVAAIAVLSFAVLVLTYIATYVVPGAHSYATEILKTLPFALMPGGGRT
jgi:ABC-type transport system involved in cytochrome c biogenesis permease subunit